MYERVNELDRVVRGFVDALLWANANKYVNGQFERDSEADGFGFDDFTEGDQRIIVQQCARFLSTTSHLIPEYALRFGEEYGEGWEGQFGHDFLLTRSGHGVGFWDRGLGELGNALTALAEAYGDISVDTSGNAPVLDEY